MEERLYIRYNQSLWGNILDNLYIRYNQSLWGNILENLYRRETVLRCFTAF